MDYSRDSKLYTIHIFQQGKIPDIATIISSATEIGLANQVSNEQGLKYKLLQDQLFKNEMVIDTVNPWVQIDQNDSRVVTMQVSSNSAVNSWQMTAANWQITVVEESR